MTTDHERSRIVLIDLGLHVIVILGGAGALVAAEADVQTTIYAVTAWVACIWIWTTK